MKYTLEERLHIGHRIYSGELTKYAAAEQYGISENCARDYMRLYRDTNHLPPKNTKGIRRYAEALNNHTPQKLEDLESMTKEQLIQNLVKVRIAEAWLKKATK